MRWVRPATRFVRLSLYQQYLSPIIGAPLLRPNGADPLSGGGQSFATQEKPRTVIALHTFRSRHTELDILEELAAVENGKHLVNPTEHLEADKHRKANNLAQVVHERDAPGRAKDDGSTSTGEHAVSAKPGKTVVIGNTAEPGPLDIAAEYEKVDENLTASGHTTAGDEPAVPRVRRCPAFSSCKPHREPPVAIHSDCTGFSIDGHGQLRIKSSTAALRKSPTALIVTSVSRNLVEADFVRLLAHPADRGNNHGGGFIQGKVDQVIYHAVSMLLMLCSYSRP